MQTYILTATENYFATFHFSDLCDYKLLRCPCQRGILGVELAWAVAAGFAEEKEQRPDDG